MTFDQFPLAGYDLARTHDYAQPDKPSALSRTFTGNSITSDGYSNHSFYVEVLSSDTSARSWVDGIKCADIRFDANTVATEVPARSVGDAAKACRIVYQNAVYLFLYTGTRNVGIIVQANVILSVPHPADAEALEALAQLAERQIAIIDQVAPPGAAMSVTSGTPKFQFTAPATLPAADAGKPYLPNGQPFSFCDPPTVGFTTQCPPPGSSARNPSGGSPPYHFQYGTMGGFPPFGMALGKDGQLTGTPNAATAGKTYRFTVCAVDLKADFVCREVSLTVTGAAQPPPVVQPPPAPVQPTSKYNYYSGTVSMNLQYRSVDGSRLKTTSLSVNATFSNFKVQVAGPSTYFTQDTLKSSGTYQYTCKDDVSGNVASTTAQGTIGSVNPAIISLRGEPKGDTLPVSINTRYSMKETGADRKLHTGAGWSRYNDCDYQVGAADIQAGTAFFDLSSDPRTRTAMWNTTTRFSPADGGYLFTHQPKISGDTINFTGQIADPKFTYDYSGTLSLKLDRTE